MGANVKKWFALNDAKEGKDLILTGRLFCLVNGMFLKLDCIPLQGEAMSSSVEWEGRNRIAFGLS